MYKMYTEFIKYIQKITSICTIQHYILASYISSHSMPVKNTSRGFSLLPKLEIQLQRMQALPPIHVNK